MLSIEQIQIPLKKFKTYLLKERNLCIFSALPLYFSWVPILSWHSKTNQIRKISLYSAINTGLFFLFLILAQVISVFPWIGAFLANLIHFVAIVIYLGLAGFLIYSVRFKKTIEIPILTDWETKLESNFAPIAQLDRVSDYGSEG